MPCDGYDLPTLRAVVLAGERPHMGRSFPGAVQRLVRACWAAEPAARLAFSVVALRLAEAAEALAPTPVRTPGEEPEWRPGRDAALWDKARGPCSSLSVGRARARRWSSGC
jgi:hypothetical protein